MVTIPDWNLFKELRTRETYSNALKPIDLLQQNRVKSLYQRDIKGHTGCVNALEFSLNEDLLLSGGDDGDVCLWATSDILTRSEPKPLRKMNSRHYSNIFTLGFSLDGKACYSAGNDNRFLKHDVETGQEIYKYEAAGTIHRLDVHPTSEGICVFSGEDDFSITIVNTGDKCKSSYQMDYPALSAMYNPVQPELLVVATYKGLAIYDTRNMKEATVQMAGPKRRCTFARWTPNGFGLIALLASDDISYYPTINKDQSPIALSDPEFLNSCTMKSCTFSDENTVLCGSDDWNIFGWKLPTEEVKRVDNAYTVLRGHRSIVNHIRYSSYNNCIVSSGVEKIIKCWSPFELQKSYCDPPRRPMGELAYGALGHHHNDSPEEDLRTLYQFDHYLRRAQRAKERQQLLGEEDSDGDSLTSEMIHEILNVALMLGTLENSDEDSYVSTDHEEDLPDSDEEEDPDTMDEEENDSIEES